MRHRPRAVQIAAALLSGAALVGCGLSAGPPLVPSVTPPALGSAAPVVVAPPPGAGLPPLSPPLEEPLAPVPTVVGPYLPPAPIPQPPQTPEPTRSADPMPSGTPEPTPGPQRLVDLLPVAAELPPLVWNTPAGDLSAAWLQLLPPTATRASAAITHLGAARAAEGACAEAADGIVAAARGAAAVSLAADPAPGAPFDVVLVRYASPEAAADALQALQRLGTTCAGVATDDGVLGAGQGAHGPTVVLRAAESALVAESAVLGALLVVVLHEGAPPEAVATLLSLPG